MRKLIFNCSDILHTSKSFVCTPEWLSQAFDKPKVRGQILKYRQSHDPKDKEELPIAYFHATFPNGKRNNKSAVPSGLVSIDVDDHDGTLGLDPRRHFDEVIDPRLHDELSHILMVYVTASGTGFRVVAKCQQGLDLDAEQKLLFGQIAGPLPPEALDLKTKDFARASFLPQREDVLYLNEHELFEGQIDEALVPVNKEYISDSASAPDKGSKGSKAGASNKSEATDASNKSEATDASNKSEAAPSKIPIEVSSRISADGAYYGDIAYADIVKELIRRSKLKLTPGERNNTIYRLACMLRHICRNEQHLQQVLPYSGLSADEVKRTVSSAYSSLTLQTNFDPTLKRALECLNDANKQGDDAPPPMPHRLPKSIQAIIEPYPETHRAAMALCSLPMLGALGTNMRFYYLEDEVHSPSFNTVLMAEQGTGKSGMTKLFEVLMAELIKRDDAYRQQDDEWRDEREAKGEKGGPKQPHFPIRIINGKATYPTFLQRMKDAKGKHLFILAPEIDTVSEKDWFQKGATLRLAFDNDRGGQDTKSSNAVSGMVPFYCNTCFSGTPSAVMGRFKNAEDGSISRTIFCTFDIEKGELRQPVKRRTEKNLQEVNEITRKLMEYGENDPDERKPKRLPRIEKAIGEWIKQKFDLYNMTLNESIRNFTIRAAVNGMRAGALTFMTEGERETKPVVDFAIWTAETALHYLTKFFGKKVIEASRHNAQIMNVRNLSSNDMVFSKLPDDFTTNDARDLFRSLELEGSGVRQTIRRWADKQWVVSTGRGLWRKTAVGQERAAFLSDSISYPSRNYDTQEE